MAQLSTFSSPTWTRNGSSLSSGRPVLRDRVVELRRVKASELLPDPRNWRRHPQAQAARVVSVQESHWGPFVAAEPHWRFEKTPAVGLRPAPRIGEHQAEILAELEPAPEAVGAAAEKSA